MEGQPNGGANMTAVDRYKAGMISVEELATELVRIGGKEWAKDVADHVLNDDNYNKALKVINNI